MVMLVRPQESAKTNCDSSEKRRANMDLLGSGRAPRRNIFASQVTSVE
jgi:hypothetical protein